MKKILVLLSLLLVLSCFDHLSESSLDKSSYDASKDQDTDLDISNSDPNLNALAYGRSHSWGGPVGQENTVYYLIANVFIDHRVNVSDARVLEVLTGHHVDSVNTLLYQAGIVIGAINIYRVKKPSNNYYYTDDFIFNKDGKLLDHDNSDSPLSNTRGSHFRMAIHKSDGSGGIASVYPASHAFAFNANSGRNLISHEIGHIFRLWHTNEIRSYPCDYSRSKIRTMLNTIFDQSWRFIDCEIAIMRQYAQNLVARGGSYSNWIKAGSNFSTTDADHVVDPNVNILVQNVGADDTDAIRRRLVVSGQDFDPPGSAGDSSDDTKGRTYEKCHN